MNMTTPSQNASFGNVQDPILKSIIASCLREMAVLLEKTTCISAMPLADQLNDIKKRAFERIYAIGHEADARELSEDVLKAIRALQDAFAQIIIAIVPMDSVAHCLKHTWMEELSAKN